MSAAADVASQREREAWTKYTASQSRADLDAWRKTLGVLHDELEHRTRLLAESVAAFRASGRRAP